MDMTKQIEGETRWVTCCNNQGWNAGTQILHLEGFIRDQGLFDKFADYAEAAAKEENEEGEDDKA